MRWPANGIAACLAQNPFADRVDQASLLRQGDEVAWCDHSSFWVSPTHERLGGCDFSGLDVDNGMIVNFELLVRQRVAQIDLEGLARARLGAHSLFEKTERVAPLRLGLVEGQVGTLHQLIDVGA